MLNSAAAKPEVSFPSLVLDPSQKIIKIPIAHIAIRSGTTDPTTLGKRTVNANNAAMA
jgi:hypothetical protein